MIPEAGRVAWARGSDIRERVKARKEGRSNGRGDVLLRDGLFRWYGFWWRFGLSGGCRGNKGNELGSILLEIGGGGSCLSLQGGGAHVGRESGGGGVDVGDPGTTAHRFRFDGAIEVELELDDRVHADAGGLSAVETVNIPRLLFEGVEASFFFPDGSVGIFSPLVAVAIAFPESGFFRGGKGVEIATELLGTGGGAWIVLAEDFSCKGREAQKAENRASEQKPVHRRIVGSG